MIAAGRKKLLQLRHSRHPWRSSLSFAFVAEESLRRLDSDQGVQGPLRSSVEQNR
jgi:hypothetical protein